MKLRKSHENPSITRIYKDFFGEPLGPKSHELLHTHYETRGVY
jgi:iron only hydrogenase large subunit-like protein